MAEGERAAVVGGRTVEEAVAAGAARLGLPVDEVDVEVLDEGGRGWLGFGAREARVKVSRPTKAAAAIRLLRRLAGYLGSRVDVEVTGPGGDPPVWSLAVVSEDSARWIGRHGQTLDAVRVWCDAAATRVSGSRDRLVVDVGGYRERRESALRFLAERAAQQVRRSGRETELEPMGPADRRIVHLALEGAEGVRTESVGEEPQRRVVIWPLR